jgi:RNA polymerase sporulation-specific sigma factor
MVDINIFNNILNESLEDLKDIELIMLVKEGNNKALEVLLNRYKNLIIKISTKYYVLGMDKEDIIQEGLIGLFEAIRNYNPDKNITFKTYLYFIVKKKFLVLLRNSNRQKRIKEVIELGENILYEDKKINEIENKQIIEKVKEKLSDLESSVLEFYLLNYTINEIAKELNLSIKTIDNSYKRIKIKIKEVISNV